ncbi:hypothetical protein DPMN_026803 [Dreissena polymorpha]|uniref:Uncharacterized protein n=1 Tax=Dreissena polymorpha TaxID=45954 RepID=A0A9D4RDV1_DREPO|nr:hypothetical protein DPMN_026803 [Dreissena polymorpha]
MKPSHLKEAPWPLLQIHSQCDFFLDCLVRIRVFSLIQINGTFGDVQSQHTINDRVIKKRQWS